MRLFGLCPHSRPHPQDSNCWASKMQTSSSSRKTSSIPTSSIRMKTCVSSLLPLLAIVHRVYFTPSPNLTKRRAQAWNGSTRVFSALLNSMLSKKKIGYGLFMGRLNQQPSFVALLPQVSRPRLISQINPHLWARDRNALFVACCLLNAAFLFVVMRISSQAEETSEDGAQLKPPGIHLIPLPFADDIRDPPIERSVSGTFPRRPLCHPCTFT